MLEITRPIAEMLLEHGTEFDLATPSGRGTATIKSMPCTCRGKDHPHEHWFLESMQFRALVPGSEIELTLHGRRIVVTNR